MLRLPARLPARFAPGTWPAYLTVGLWSLTSVFFVLWVIAASFKSTRELFSKPWGWPKHFSLDNYLNVWQTHHFDAYFWNSLVAVGVSVALLLLVCVPAAYVLTRARFRLQGAIRNLVIFGMGVPIPLLFVPLVGIATKLGVVDSLPGLILVYVALSIPFTIFVLIGFFSSLPSELEAAAIIDGCSDWQVFWHVMLPLASPGIITVAILNFIGLWNEYQLSLVLLSSPEHKTLSLGVYSLISSMQYSGGDWPGLFAGISIVMAPSILIFVILSEKIISGITMAGVK